METKTTADRLRELRVDRDMTQREVGEVLGIPQQQYSQYETGQIDLPLRYLRKLIDLFDVSADYLLGRTQRPENKSFRNVQVTKGLFLRGALERRPLAFRGGPRGGGGIRAPAAAQGAGEETLRARQRTCRGNNGRNGGSPMQNSAPRRSEREMQL